MTPTGKGHQKAPKCATAGKCSQFTTIRGGPTAWHTSNSAARPDEMVSMAQFSAAPSIKHPHHQIEAQQHSVLQVAELDRPDHAMGGNLHAISQASSHFHFIASPHENQQPRSFLGTICDSYFCTVHGRLILHISP